MSPGSPAPPSRRLAAFTLDMLLLSAAGLLLVYGRFAAVAQLGGHGPLIGALIATGYFLATSQPLTGLRTAGQRLLGLAQVPATAPWSPKPGVFLAPLLLVVPLYLLHLWDLHALADLAANRWRWAAVTLGISVLLANGVLVAAADGQRRLLHDRLAETRIVLAALAAPLRADGLAAWRWGVIACLPAVVVVVLTLAVPRPQPPAADDEMVFQADGMPAIISGVERLTYRIRSEAGREGATVVEVTALVLVRPESPGALAATISRVLAAQGRMLGAAREMRVRFVRRADLGIAWRTVSQQFTVTPAQWRAATLPQAPTAPDDAKRRGAAPRAGTSPDERAQGAASIDIARPMLTAMKEYWRAHLDTPDAGTIDTNPAFRTIDERGVRVSMGRSGSIDVKFVSGPLAPYSYSWVLMTGGVVTQWVCAHPNIPAEDLGEECK